MIYAMQVGGCGPIKIGFADNPKARREHIQTHHWDRVDVLRVWVGTPRDERLTQSVFRDKHVRGEWFDITLADLDMVTLARADDEASYCGGCERSFVILADGKRQITDERRKRLSVAIRKSWARQRPVAGPAV